MAIQPLQPSDPFEAAGQLSGNSSGNFSSNFNSGQSFTASSGPAQSGFGTQQSQVPNNRLAVNARNLMRWLVPEQPIVEMYINPQSVNYGYSKQITETRTKGGFSLQYWGENLTTLALQGTTGTSGIEGINVLYEVYRNEQLMFDPYALALQAQVDSQQQSDSNFDLFGQSLSGNSPNGADSSISQISNILSGKTNIPQGTRSRPTLASMAFTVELYWSGEVYRGFFKDFSVVESVNNLGMFDYTINFRVTQKRGFRTNFLGWHRSATSGPSNSNPQFGTPYSFSGLVAGTPTAQRNAIDQPNLNQPFVSPGLKPNSNLNDSSSSVLNAFDVG
jgi:hypothetical protein